MSESNEEDVEENRKEKNKKRKAKDDNQKKQSHNTYLDFDIMKFGDDEEDGNDDH